MDLLSSDMFILSMLCPEIGKNLSSGWMILSYTPGLPSSTLLFLLCVKSSYSSLQIYLFRNKERKKKFAARSRGRTLRALFPASMFRVYKDYPAAESNKS